MITRHNLYKFSEPYQFMLANHSHECAEPIPSCASGSRQILIAGASFSIDTPAIGTAGNSLKTKGRAHV
jgi:hypothetical protein